jgi:hypothetical protein
VTLNKPITGGYTRKSFPVISHGCSRYPDPHTLFNEVKDLMCWQEQKWNVESEMKWRTKITRWFQVYAKSQPSRTKFEFKEVYSDTKRVGRIHILLYGCHRPRFPDPIALNSRVGQAVWFSHHFIICTHYVHSTAASSIFTCSISFTQKNNNITLPIT